MKAKARIWPRLSYVPYSLDSGSLNTLSLLIYSRCSDAVLGTLGAYRGTLRIRKHLPLEPYSRPMSRALWGS